MNAAEIVQTFRRRQAQRAPFTTAAEIVLAHYEGRTRVAMPELDSNEHVAIANLMVQAVDQTGARIASTEPMTTFRPDRPDSHSSQVRARQRGQAIRGLHVANQLKLKRRQRARWLIAYGTAPVVLRPWKGSVIWQPRSPLATFPAPMSELDQMVPEDCIFTHTQTWWWLRTNFPEEAMQLRRNKACRDDDEFVLLEYVSNDTWMLIVLAREPYLSTSISIPGPTSPYARTANPTIDRVTTSMYAPTNTSGTQAFMKLTETPNRAKTCPVVIPSRIGLEGPTGQFNQMVSLFQEQAKLMALELNAVTEAIFPQQWAVQRANEQLEVTVTPNARLGRIGEMRGGDLQTVQINPGFQTYPTIDRLERAQKMTGGIPADYSGDTRTHISGARGDAVFAAVTDFPMQEAQELLAQSEFYENVAAIAVLRGHYPNTDQDFGSVWRGRGPVTWTAAKLFPDERSATHEVKYAFSGTDLNGQTIRIGQKLGLKQISLQTSRENDPEIDDPELEKDRVLAEALEGASIASLQQQAASGAIPPEDMGRITELVMSDRMELYEAIAVVQKEAQARQAAVAPPGAPALQPGLSLPGAGSQASSGAPPASLQNMTQTLGALRLGQHASGAEQQAEAVAQAAG